MCLSGVGQIVFGIIMTSCFILTCVAMFSPNWRSFRDDTDDKMTTGLFKFNCKFPGTNENDSTDRCGKDWWKHLHTWEKVTVVMMCLALATELLCLAWNLFACFACCCKGIVIHPLTFFAVLVTLWLAIAVIVYGANTKDSLKDIDWGAKDAPKTEIGYSFYMAVAALVLALVDVVVASVTVFLAKKCC
ncbi:unnamed protein product, partial [Mesorhabditis belari]|uniref:Uncharacterized protein n=1 Tax=Mesorhabditis belari TaxID=2138241 RepID=A0AAF3EUQ3_9BILA